jgi:hypothetical protein
MRKMIAVVVGLVSVVLAVAVLVCARMGTPKAPVRVGMTKSSQREECRTGTEEAHRHQA